MNVDHHQEEEEGKDDEQDVLIVVNVGGYSYTTTTSVLLSKHHEEEEHTYFRSILSGRWTTTNQSTTSATDSATSIDIRERDGRLFFYILYYLKTGDLRCPLQSSQNDSILAKEDLVKLQIEADFFGLQGLVKCIKLVLLGPLKGWPGSVGDLDLSPYSDFHVKTHKNNKDGTYYSMKYRYNKDAMIRVVYSKQCPKKIYMWCDPTVIGKYLDQEKFASKFRYLQVIIPNLFDNNNDDSFVPKVSEVLANTNIPKEFHLWWAMEINAMIEFYLKEKKKWGKFLNYRHILKFPCHDWTGSEYCCFEYEEKDV